MYVVQKQLLKYCSHTVLSYSNTLPFFLASDPGQCHVTWITLGGGVKRAEIKTLYGQQQYFNPEKTFYSRDLWDTSLSGLLLSLMYFTCA